MDAIYQDGYGRQPVTVVGVLYGARVQIRFEGSGEVIVPIALLEVDSIVAAELEQWRRLPPGLLTDDEYRVLEDLSRAGDAGLLDSQYGPGLDRKRVEVARRMLRVRGLVGPVDARPVADGRQVRWRLTKQGVVEYVSARVKVRPIAVGGGRQLVTAIG